MVYDLTMLEAFYSAYKGKVEHVRAVLKRPLTLAEKILYAHLFNEGDLKNYKRGEDYVNFRPDRVAMQDATAQMALLQFMNAGKEKVAVPSTVHCDHLIQAYKGAKEDIATATKTNEEVYGILSGKGKVIIDGEEITLTAGDWIRISPSAKRQFFAAEDVGISFVCVQTKENSLEKFTANDAVVY